MSKITKGIVTGVACGAFGYTATHLLKQSVTTKTLVTIILVASGFALGYYVSQPSSVEATLDASQKNERRIIFVKKK